MNEHHVRCIDITFCFHDAALTSATATRAKMSLLETNAFDAHATLAYVHRDDAALCGLRRTGTAHDLNEVALFYLLHLVLPLQRLSGVRMSGERLCIR